jgi:hypothetical protein
MIYSKIATFGRPNYREVSTKYPRIARSESGRQKQNLAAEEMVTTGSCTDARVICHHSLKAIQEADISDYTRHGCWQEQ